MFMILFLIILSVFVNIGTINGQEQKVTVYPFLNKKKSNSQGMDIYSDTMFVFSHGGKCTMYDYNKKCIIGRFYLEDAEGYHCNCVNFGPKKDYRNPFIYISNGRQGHSEEFVCRVASIVNEGDSILCKTIQKIALDTSNFLKNNLHKPWGCPQWLVDRKRGFLWVFSSDKRTLPKNSYSGNVYHATQFRIPRISEGYEITLTYSDVLSQKCFLFDTFVTQGGCMDDGLIYYSFGFANEKAPTKIRVYNTDTGKIDCSLDLGDIVKQEPEDLAIYNNFLYLNTVCSIYSISLDSLKCRK